MREMNTEAIENIMENVGDMGDENMIKDIEAQLLNLIEHTQHVPATLYHHWMAFVYAVDWSEPWLIGLLTFYAFLVITIIVCRDNMTVQTVIYVLLGVMVYLSERFNSYLSVHWNDFARQNYFDVNGVFTTTVFCFPLLLILVFQLIIILKKVSTDMVAVKRLQLRQSASKTRPTANEESVKGTKND